MRAAITLGVLVAALAAGHAAAASKTGQFAVRSQVVADCQITTQDLDFGTYSSDAAARANTPLTVKCTPGSSATISLSPGSSGNPQARTMKGPGDLAYQIYRDAALTDPINTAGMAYQIQASDNTGQTYTYTLYGEVASGQNVPAGGYVDTIQVNVSY